MKLPPARLRLVVQSPQLWDVDTPALYAAEAALTSPGNAAPVDRASTRFGIRTVAVDAVHGLRVNGKTVKLKGGCIHHVTSPLGAADFDCQTRRVLKAHKEAGYNALRLAHNPPLPAVLDLCDEYGLFVIDVAFDGWHVGKNAPRLPPVLRRVVGAGCRSLCAAGQKPPQRHSLVHWQ